MIQEFSVQNFLSIKEKQTISFEASPDKKAINTLTVEVKPNVRLLKMAVIYGANASGKSNMLFALENVWQRLFYAKSQKDKIINFTPFIQTENEPTHLSVTFFALGIKYQYSVSYNEEAVLSELLEYAPEGVMSLFYSRERNTEGEVPVIRFGNNLKLTAKAKNSLTENTFNNHSVLSTYSKISVDAPAFETLYNWIKQNIHESYSSDTFLDIVKDVVGNNSKKKFILEAINKADFNISEIQFVEEELPEELKAKIKEDKDLSEKTKTRILSRKNEDVEFTHHFSTGDFTLNRKMESKGTLQYFTLLSKLYDSIANESVHFIDEIGENLHDDLQVHYLSFYLLNSNKSQLIFTTHNQLLLDEDFIRRDMVWFTEKSKETCATELYSALDFGLHTNVSLYKAYKVGKLGAKPEIGSPFID